MTLWSAFDRAYSDSWRFVVALPLIALAIVGFEGLQHLAEWHIGLYADAHAARATADHPLRMIPGYAKIAWLLVIQFWVTRFMVGRSARRALAAPASAVRAFALVLVVQLALALLTLRLPALLQAMAGLEHRQAAAAGLVFALVTGPLGIALIPWTVGAALGDPRASPAFALRQARIGPILWGLVFTAVATLPPFLGHMVLGLGAIGRPPVQAIPMLVVDAVLVGFLGVVTSAIQVQIAARMAARDGETLVLA